MDDLTPILDLVYNRYNLGKLDKINILEIGTGEGKNSTKILYNFFKKNKFNIISYEGMDKLYNIASNYWKNTNNVTIVNEYFTKKTIYLNYSFLIYLHTLLIIKKPVKDL
jgi:hypothetical protein